MTTPEPSANGAPRDRFLRLAPKRTTAVLERIRLLSNCAGPGYELTPVEAREIIVTLRGAVDELEHEFNRRLLPRQNTFAFSNLPHA
jgi:hypothetical protein